MTKKTQSLFFLLAVIFCLEPKLPARADQITVFSESLRQAQEKAKQFSGMLKSSSAAAAAALSQAKAAGAPLLPQLNLQGNYFYQTNVPSVALGSAAPTSFGTHDNYSAGPVLSYTLFDAGQARKNRQSAEASAQSRLLDYSANERALMYTLKLVYFRVQLALNNLSLTADSLKLSQAQDRDIDLRFQAGRVSLLERASSHKETLGYQMKFLQAQTALAVVLRDLFSLTGETNNYDTSRPIPEDLSQNLPEGVGTPTMKVALDSLESSLDSLTSFFENNQKGLTGLPQIKSLALSSEASRLSAQSQKRALWPKVTLSAKSEILYPNAVIAEEVVNNIYSLTFSLPIFDGRLNQNLAAQRMNEALAADYQKEQRLSDFSRDYWKAFDALQSLKSQQKISLESVEEDKEIARLTYQSYQVGKVNYLEVQSANLRLLETRVNHAEIKQQVLNQLALLEFLSPPTEEKRP